jgi:hypothetical protein
MVRTLTRDILNCAYDEYQDTCFYLLYCILNVTVAFYILKRIRKRSNNSTLTAVWERHTEKTSTVFHLTTTLSTTGGRWFKYKHGEPVESSWQRKPLNARRQISPTIALSTRNPTWTALGSNSNFRNHRPVTISLSHGTARKGLYVYNS